jgi:AcrR family transcriptional regulator
MNRVLTQKAQNTRSRIIDSASHLFAEHGYHATKLDLILAECGVRKGNFYYYFISKDELALVVLKERIRPQVEENLRQLDLSSGKERDKVGRILAIVYGAMGQGRDGLSHNSGNLLLEFANLSSEHAVEAGRILRLAEDRIASVLTREDAEREARLLIALGAGASVLASSDVERWGVDAVLDAAIPEAISA